MIVSETVESDIIGKQENFVVSFEEFYFIFQLKEYK